MTLPLIQKYVTCTEKNSARNSTELGVYLFYNLVNTKYFRVLYIIINCQKILLNNWDFSHILLQ